MFKSAITLVYTKIKRGLAVILKWLLILADGVSNMTIFPNSKAKNLDKTSYMLDEINKLLSDSMTKLQEEIIAGQHGKVARVRLLAMIKSGDLPDRTNFYKK